MTLGAGTLGVPHWTWLGDKARRLEGVGTDAIGMVSIATSALTQATFPIVGAATTAQADGFRDQAQAGTLYSTDTMPGCRGVDDIEGTTVVVHTERRGVQKLLAVVLALPGGVTIAERKVALGDDCTVTTERALNERLCKECDGVAQTTVSKSGATNLIESCNGDGIRVGLDGCLCE